MKLIKYLISIFEIMEKNPSLYTNDLSTIRQAFGSGTLMLVDAVALGIMAFIKMSEINFILLLVCLIPLVLISGVLMIMRRRISKKVKLDLEAFSNMSDYVQEDFSGISVIKAYVKEKRREFLFLDHNKNNMDTTMKIVGDQALLNVLIGSIISIGIKKLKTQNGIVLLMSRILLKQ